MKKSKVILNTFLLFLLVFITDVIFDFEESIFYLIPVSYLSWNLKNLNLNFLLVLMSSFTWMLTAKLTELSNCYSDIKLSWNTLILFCFLYIISNLIYKLKTLLEKEHDLARVDTLTKLYNKRALQEHIETEIERIKRYKTYFSICYIDLDGFKKVNDVHGHTKGDFVLTTISQIIRDNVRVTDFPARIGGDEFVVVFFETDENSIKTVVERIRANIEEKMKELNFYVTASIGVITYKNEPTSFDDIIKMSDEKMYEAKNTGKNKIIYSVFK